MDTLGTLKDYLHKRFSMNTDIEPLSQATIDEITRRFVKIYNPREIYMLEPIREENIDTNFLIIVDGEDIEHYELMTKGYKALIGVKVAKNIMVYTPAEFAEYSQDSSSLSFLIKKYGKRIYENS